MTLRPYQTTFLHDVAAAFRGASRVLGVMPTGAGKTVCFTAEAAATPGRVLVVAHRRELIRQAHASLVRAGVDASIYPSATPGRVWVGSIQTLSRRTLPPFRKVIVDEAHHAVAPGYAVLLDAQPQADVLGVTATPSRLDGRGLGTVFQRMVVGPTMAELVTAGHLVPARCFAPPTGGPDLSRVRMQAGEYRTGDLAEVMDKPSITGDAASHYEALCPFVPAIAFCVSVDHAMHTAAAFRAEGWRAVAVHGGMTDETRDAALTGLASGAYHVVTSCSLIDEGLDVPGVGCILDLAPTQSLGRYLQRAGRAMRPAPGKTVMWYLDHAGNVLRHGLPEMPRVWTLDAPKRRADTTPAVAQCPECYALHVPSRMCPACGHDYEAAKTEGARRELLRLMGELRELSSDDVRLAHLATVPFAEAIRGVRSRADLELVAQARGYDPGWINRMAGMRRFPVEHTGGSEFL